MKKLQSIKSLEKLSLAEMADVKGGGSFNVSALGATLSVSTTDSSISASLTTKVGTFSVTLDDKRRDRPGGGITTL